MTTYEKHKGTYFAKMFAKAFVILCIVCAVLIVMVVVPFMLSTMMSATPTLILTALWMVFLLSIAIALASMVLNG
jgi:membrane protein YdbS with pleckstrin-like domain